MKEKSTLLVGDSRLGRLGCGLLMGLLSLTARPADEPAALPTIPLAPDHPDAIPLAGDGGGRHIEEVIVTATKRQEDRRDIPLSIDAYTGDQLEKMGATDLQSMLRYSTGVSVSPGLDAESTTVIFRGVSTDTFFTFFTRTFGIFYEDVSLVNPSILGPQPNIDPYDLATVEVLKGPQGTLFGGSALSGAVRFVPQHPDFSAAYGSAMAGVGTLARSGELSRQFAAMWNQPIGDELAARFVASRRYNPGYVRDSRAGTDDINSSDSDQYRGILSWHAADDFELRLNALLRETHQDNGAFATTDQAPVDEHRFLPDTTDSRTAAFLLTANWGFDAFDVVAIASDLTKEYHQVIDYSTFLGTSLVGVGAYGDMPSKSSQPSLELRLVSRQPTESGFAVLDGWNYVGGYYTVYTKQQLIDGIGVLHATTALTLSGNVDALENALFFDVSRKLGDNWELGVGGRLFRQSTQAKIVTQVLGGDSSAANDPLAPLLSLVPGTALSTVDGSIGETVFNPKFTLQRRFSRDLSAYASAIKGFRYAGANQNPSMDPKVPLFFKSDSIWNYELGLRSRWLDGKLQVDATVFHLTWDNLQIQQRDYTGAFAYTTNVGGARTNGVEVSVNALLPWDLSLLLNAGYTDARTTTFFNDFQGPAPSGTELPGSSPFKGSAVLAYARSVSAIDLQAAVSYTYQNRNYNNLPHLYEHPPLGLLGANASAKFNRWPGAPEFSLIGNNLTNEFKPGVVFETPNSGGIGCGVRNAQFRRHPDHLQPAALGGAEREGGTALAADAAQAAHLAVHRQ